MVSSRTLDEQATPQIANMQRLFFVDATGGTGRTLVTSAL